ncbi:hypothetical protein BGX24_007931, partial [Mortierella sp. AD032]
MDVVAALLMERVELPKDIPDNMLRALEVSNSNHSGDMQELRKVLIAVNDKLTQQSNQGLWANSMLAGIAKAFLAQQEQLRIQSETIQSMQEAIDSMARQQRLPGPSIYGGATYSGYPGASSLGVPVPVPGFLPQHGPFSGSLVSAPRNKQFKTKPSK